MVQGVQWRHATLTSQNATAAKELRQIFLLVELKLFSLPKSAVGTDVTLNSKAVLWSSTEGPIGEHLGAVGSQRDELNIL